MSVPVGLGTLKFSIVSAPVVIPNDVQAFPVTTQVRPGGF